MAIARAIAKQPRVLFCDEPTGALTAKPASWYCVVLEAIARVNRELGTTAMIITHSAAIAAMADRVLSMADGQILQTQINRQPCDPSELSW